ncbi:MAG: WD40 repeat protein [Nonlabens sp.]|jgi:WD40 repeat protein
MRHLLISILFCTIHFSTLAQNSDSLLSALQNLQSQVNGLKNTEIVQSMSQRSILMPSYFGELKALIARQAYNFWLENDANPLVSHLNLYSALYYANKYLGYDSVYRKSYNEALGHTESVISIQFGKDPDYFYSAGSDGRVLKWSLKSFGSPATVLYDGKHLIKSIEVSNDDRYILVVTKNEGIILIDNNPSDREGLKSFTQDKELVQTALFVPNELKLMIVTKAGDIKYKMFNSEEVIGNTTEQVSSAIINEENNKLFLGNTAGNLQIWEDTLAAKIYLQESFAINALAINSDYTQLAIGREKGDVIIWDLKTESLIRTISGHQSAITDLDFSPDDQMLLSASRDRTVRVWDVNNSRKLPLVLDDHNDWVLTACFDPSGERIISGSRDNFIRFWPVKHEELANRICDMIGRNLTRGEWEEYVGSEIPYKLTCPSVTE